MGRSRKLHFARLQLKMLSMCFQHYPLYRTSDAECTGEDAAPLNERYQLFQERYDVLSQDASKKVRWKGGVFSHLFLCRFWGFLQPDLTCKKNYIQSLACLNVKQSTLSSDHLTDVSPYLVCRRNIFIIVMHCFWNLQCNMADIDREIANKKLRPYLCSASLFRHNIRKLCWGPCPEGAQNIGVIWPQSGLCSVWPLSSCLQL